MRRHRLEAHHARVEQIRAVLLALEDVRDVVRVAALQRVPHGGTHERRGDVVVAPMLRQHGEAANLRDPTPLHKLRHIKARTGHRLETVLRIRLQRRVEHHSQHPHRLAVAAREEPRHIEAVEVVGGENLIPIRHPALLALVGGTENLDRLLAFALGDDRDHAEAV